MFIHCKVVVMSAPIQKLWCRHPDVIGSKMMISTYARNARLIRDTGILTHPKQADIHAKRFERKPFLHPGVETKPTVLRQKQWFGNHEAVDHGLIQWSGDWAYHDTYAHNSTIMKLSKIWGDVMTDQTIQRFFDSISDERKPSLEKLHTMIRTNLPRGFETVVSIGMLNYVVPLATYPKGYHTHRGEPLL